MRVAFSWNGLPQYAALELRAAADVVQEVTAIVGSRPSVPIKGMDEVVGRTITWIDADTATSWKRLGLAVPEIFIQSGWSYPAFSSLGKEVKKAGGKVIGLSDANWRGDFRQLILGPIAFRAVHKHHFDAMLVPGAQGARLMRWFGFEPRRVRMGMYGADPQIFQPGPALNTRSKTFLFVGQLIHRKDVLGLIRAFLQVTDQIPEWTLRICGSGPLRDQIPSHTRIIVEDFVQPRELSLLYKSARFLVLPSLVEAWGLVVHEAALSGCGLLLSDQIGSAPDLASRRNSISFRAGATDQLAKTLLRAAALTADELAEMNEESLAKASGFGPSRFAKEICSFLRELTNDKTNV